MQDGDRADADRFRHTLLYLIIMQQCTVNGVSLCRPRCFQCRLQGQLCAVIRTCGDEGGRTVCPGLDEIGVEIGQVTVPGLVKVMVAGGEDE